MVQFNANLNLGKTVGLTNTTQTGGAVEVKGPNNTPDAKPCDVYAWGDRNAKDGDYWIGADGKAYKVTVKDGLTYVAKKGKKITEKFALKNGCDHDRGRTSYSWIDLLNGNY